MEDKREFLEKLAGLLAFCESKGNEIEKSEVEEYFGEENLTEEQMILVFDYLLAKKVLVKRYMKAGETFDAKEEVVALTAEETEYLDIYEKDLEALKGSDDIVSRLLPEVVSIAKEMNHQEIFIGDLIQEGNMGLLSAVSDGENEKEKLTLVIREAMQLYLESQIEIKVQDKKMEEKVNNLDGDIKKLTEEMGRKVTLDELSHFTNTSEEEIEDILRLAGEEVGDAEEEEE